MSTALVPQRGITNRQEFAADQVERSPETALAAVAARERALVEARYLMAERHPRVWLDVRAQMLDHCRRPRFAEITRYSRPVGWELKDGEWIEKQARGFTIRFAETLAQEMRNVQPDSSVTFDDDMMRIVRIGVTDLQANVPWSREVAFAKTVEKRGKKMKDGSWNPPEGREVLSQRINSRGEPSFLVMATDEELRAKINSEIAKTQRDFIIKLCPRDILEDCEGMIYDVLEHEDKADPKAATKKWLDGFARGGVVPSDLVNYLGKPVEQWTDKEIKELRELAAAIKEGASFNELMKARWDKTPGPDEEETQLQRQARHRKQSEDQLAAGQARVAEEQAKAEKRKGLRKVTDSAAGDLGGRQSDTAQEGAGGRQPEHAAEPSPPAFGTWGDDLCLGNAGVVFGHVELRAGVWYGYVEGVARPVASRDDKQSAQRAVERAVEQLAKEAPLADPNGGTVTQRRTEPPEEREPTEEEHREALSASLRREQEEAARLKFGEKPTPQGFGRRR